MNMIHIFMTLEMGYQFPLESSDFLNIVARLKTISELELFNELNVDIFCVDTFYTAKRISNFTLEQLMEITNRVHQMNKLIYAYVNPMVHEYMLEPINAYLLELKNMNIDGIIINDLTIYILAKKIGIEKKVIYQPGTMNTDSYSLEYFENRIILGITISREITLEEIEQITSNKRNIRTSLIGHGYLDMFYSKRKLLTNYAIHKNLNGEQLVNNYSLRLNEEMRKEEYYPILQDEYGTHVFRSKKLISYDEFKELNQAIDDFFIERIFLDDNEYYDSIRMYQHTMSKSEFLNKYSDFDSGFYYQRTEKRKGELDEN